MTQIVSSKPYCLENSTQLTRPASDTFYRIDGSNGPTIIDKSQAKRLYRLQRPVDKNPGLQLENSDVNYESQGYFDSIVRKQVEESTTQPIKSEYRKPTDMSNTAMTRFSLGKARLDPQRIVPSEMTILRQHPFAIKTLRHEQDSNNNETRPRFNDRLVSDRALRARLGPGGILNPEEDCKEAEKYLRNQGRLSAPSTLTYKPTNQSQPSVGDQLKRDELARQYMYTSTQQAAFNEVPWDSKLPGKLPIPPSTYEAEGSDPVLQSKHLTPLNDSRSREILEWDRTQMRNVHFYRKPIENVAPLPRANHISGYSGSIGGYYIQDIDDPTVDFKPYTVVRTEQPKFGINPFKTNIPFYTGKSHWTKVDPVSHYDSLGRPYTTTAAFHKPLPLENAAERRTELNGQLSRAVTTVIPQNPFNHMDISSTTTNGSLDSRSQILIPDLPRSVSAPSKDNKTNQQKEIKPDQNQNK